MSEILIQNEVIYRLAGLFHEQWRTSRSVLEDGRYEPDIEITEDELWALGNGGTEVDIANVSFDQLPADLQRENMDAANTVIGILNIAIAEGRQLDADFIEEASDKVHQAWLERNPQDEDIEDLRLSYTELPEEEKAKDRNQVLLGIELISSQN